MHVKKILTAILLTFAIGSIVYMIARESATKPADPGAGDNPPAPVVQANDTSPSVVQIAEPTRQFIVYYFHGNMRCPTCHKLENYAKEAIETYFAEDLASEQIQWRAVNVDIPENEHFVTDYQLVTKSVVLSQIADGKEIKWKNLDQIWNLVMEKSKYIEYICDSVQTFLEEDHS